MLKPVVPAPTWGDLGWRYVSKKSAKKEGEFFFLQKFDEKNAQNKLKQSRLLPSEDQLHCALNDTSPHPRGILVKDIFRKKCTKNEGEIFFLQKISERIAQNNLKQSRLLPSENPLHCASNNTSPHPGGILVKDIFRKSTKT